MVQARQELIVAVLSVAILFVILSTVIVFVILRYKMRQQKHFQEIEQINVQFKNELIHTQLEIQEQTLNHISQEIHDNVGQILSLAKVQINIMNKTGDRSEERLNEVKDFVGKAMSDLRDLARSLSSDRIRMLDMHQSIAEEIERINRSGAGNISLVVRGDKQSMSDAQKLILFRIVQESINNTLKHAQASAMHIICSYKEDMLEMSIEDNGIGFDTATAMNLQNGLGLYNIQNRALLARGAATIASEPGKGTLIIIHIPYA